MTAARIVPGAIVHDDRGRVAQLHGIGVLRLGDRFWAWGEEKSAGSTFTAVVAYSSADLATWRFEGDALTPVAQHPVLGHDRIVERPKVLYNAATQTYVMFVHLDSADYSDALLGVATSRLAEGPFTLVRSERPLGNLSRDIGVYEEDGTAFLLSEDRENGLHIYRLSPDFTRVEQIVSTTRKPGAAHGYESPALIRHEGRYFLFGSDLTGWSHNDNKYATSTSLRGPWSPWSDFAPPGSATFDSQVSVIVALTPADGRRGYAYVGDRWRKDDLANSPLVVLPLHIDGDRAHMAWVDSWSLAEIG